MSTGRINFDRELPPIDHAAGQAYRYAITPGFFETLDIPLTQRPLAQRE